MSEFELGRHEAQIADLSRQVRNVERTVSNVDAKLDGVIVALAERRGERKALAMLATVAGAVGSVVVTVLLKLFRP